MLVARKRKKSDAANSWPTRLKALRARHKLTQAAAAEKVGVALRTWIGWENYQRRPSGPAIRLLQLTFPTDF